MKYFLTGGAVILVDQAVKYAVRQIFQPGDSVQVLGDFFRLTYIQNEGAAWGMMAGKQTFLILLTMVVIIGAIWYMHHEPNMSWLGKLPITMIAAGGIGNLIDRVILRYVTDMFDFSIFPPVFNVADISVTCGCALLIFYVIWGENLEKRGRTN